MERAQLASTSLMPGCPMMLAMTSFCCGCIPARSLQGMRQASLLRGLSGISSNFPTSCSIKRVHRHWRAPCVSGSSSLSAPLGAWYLSWGGCVVGHVPDPDYDDHHCCPFNACAQHHVPGSHAPRLQKARLGCTILT